MSLLPEPAAHLSFQTTVAMARLAEMVRHECATREHSADSFGPGIMRWKCAFPIHIVNYEDTTDIAARDFVIMAVTDMDSAALGMTRQALAAQYAGIIELQKRSRIPSPRFFQSAEPLQC